MFEFSTKAKQLAIGLTVVGAILWIVGFAMNGSSSHEADHGHDTHATEMHADGGHDAHAEYAHDAHAEHENDYPNEAHASMIESTYESIMLMHREQKLTMHMQNTFITNNKTVLGVPYT